jgi:ATP-binding cassette subfamily B protein
MNAVIKPETIIPLRTLASPTPSGLGCLVIVARHHGLHLSVSQLVHDHLLTGQEVSIDQILKCATSSGLRARVVELNNWNSLRQLRKAMPAIVRLRNGGSMVLLRLEGEEHRGRAVLQDPDADPDALLVLDRVRFEDVWTGEVILVKRDYEISDEDQPFGLGLLAALLFRERWIVRDVTICAVMLGFLALTPIMFWRLMSDRVLYFKAYNTFYVLCLAMIILILFEAGFSY